VSNPLPRSRKIQKHTSSTKLFRESSKSFYNLYLLIGRQTIMRHKIAWLKYIAAAILQEALHAFSLSLIMDIMYFLFQEKTFDVFFYEVLQDGHVVKYEKTEISIPSAIFGALYSVFSHNKNLFLRLIAYVLSFILTFYLRVAEARVVADFVFDVREKVYRIVLKQNYQFFVSNDLGNITDRLDEVPDLARDILEVITREILGTVGHLIGDTVAIFMEDSNFDSLLKSDEGDQSKRGKVASYLNKQSLCLENIKVEFSKIRIIVFLLSIAWCLAYIYFVFRLLERINSLAKTHSISLSKLTSVMIDSIGNIFNIQSSAGSDHEIKYFRNFNKKESIDFKNFLFYVNRLKIVHLVLDILLRRFALIGLMIGYVYSSRSLFYRWQEEIILNSKATLQLKDVVIVIWNPVFYQSFNHAYNQFSSFASKVADAVQAIGYGWEAIGKMDEATRFLFGKIKRSQAIAILRINPNAPEAILYEDLSNEREKKILESTLAKRKQQGKKHTRKKRIGNKIVESDAISFDQIPNLDLEINNLSFSYHRSERPIINHLNLKIPYGTKLGIVGETGCGKSTLTNLILRLFQPNDGQIKLGGLDVEKLDRKKYRKLFAIIPQQPILFNRSILENITYSIEDDSLEKEKIMEKLEEMMETSLLNFVKYLPEKLGSIVGNRGERLSGGQRQRVMIARAVLCESKIYILDEATSALDSKTERTISEIITEVTKNKTSITIAHHLNTLRGCDKIIFLRYGSIIESGTFEELLQKRGPFYTLYSHMRMDENRES